jgi:phytochelatin synthase
LLASTPFESRLKAASHVFHFFLFLIAERGPRMRSSLLLLSLVVGLLSGPALAFEGKPKLGPDAVPITQRTAYLRSAPAPDYWTLSPFYEAQRTSSDCSVASVTMAVNFLRGLPAGAAAPIVTQSRLLAKIADAQWTDEVAEGGSGVTFAEFVAIVNRALVVFDLQDHSVEVVRPTGDTAEALADLRRTLTRNEASDQDVVLVYFNQGVLTGDWDGPHISPIAAYDEETRQVLIMDVTREWYVPYWTADTTLLRAMLRPAPAEHGRLAGETGGLVWIRPLPHDERGRAARK